MNSFCRATHGLRRLWRVAAVLALAGCSGANAVRVHEDPLAAAVEFHGARGLRVPVSVGAVERLPESGAIRLLDVVVENPPGFEIARAIEIPVITLLHPDPSNRATEVIVESPRIAYEWSAGGSNLDILLYTAQTFLRGQRARGKRLRVDRFVIRGARMDLADVWLNGELVSLPLEEIVVENPGGALGYPVPEMLLTDVFKALQQESNRAIAQCMQDLDHQREAVMGELHRAEWEWEQFFSE